MKNIEIRTAANVRVHRSHMESNKKPSYAVKQRLVYAFQMHRGPTLQRLQGTRLPGRKSQLSSGPFRQTLSLLYNFGMNLILQNIAYGYWRDSFLDFVIPSCVVFDVIPARQTDGRTDRQT